MPKLYELTDDYNNLLSMVDSGDFSADDIADTLAGIHGMIDDKLQATVCVIKEMEAEAKKFDDEIKRMSEVKKSYSNTATRLKEYIRFEMEKSGIEKSKGLFSISLGKPSKVVEISSTDNLPDKYKKVSVSADKTAIGSDLKAGVVIPGAELVDGKPRLTIR